MNQSLLKRKKNKRKTTILFFYFLLLPFVVWGADTSRIAPFIDINASFQDIQMPYGGVAGLGPIEDQFLIVKRIKQPSPDSQEPDMEHIAKKNKISAELEARKRNDFRRGDELTDSLRIALGFESNQFMASTPMDNNIAVSRDGIVISVINTNIFISDTLGEVLQSRPMTPAFFGDASLASLIYDPKILYDPDEDRFILVILSGNTPTNSRVIVCFSRSNRPDIDGWNYFSYNGNVYNNSLWFDYPNIGINKRELFITGNLFTAQDEYRLTTIIQISKQDGYAGTNPANARIWGAGVGFGVITNSQGNIPFTLVPAPNAFEDDDLESMHFISSFSNSGNSLDLFRVTARLGNSPTIQTSRIAVPLYMSERFCSQLGPTGTPFSVLLNAGDARMKNAYYQNGVLHCVLNARQVGQNFLGLFYYRIDLKNELAITAYFYDEGTDYGFAAVAPISNDPLKNDALIVYTHTSGSIYPGIGMITCDKNMTFSAPKLIKEGESFVNVLPSNGRTRWGDYSGIAKRHGTANPEIWISACFGAHTPTASFSRHWKNWNAKIVSKESATITFEKNRVWPNPITNEMPFANFSFDAPEAGNYKIVLYDITGKALETVFENSLLSGKHNITFATTRYPSGQYIIRCILTDKSKSWTEKWIKIGGN